MNIPHYFSPVVNIAAWAMFAISVVALAIGIAAAAGAVLPLNINPAQGTLLIFSSSLAAVLTLALATIHYRITDTHIRLNVFFVDVLSGRIRLDNVLNVVKKQDKLYISYLWKGEDPVIAQIAVKPKYFDKIKNAITSANPKVRYYDETEDSSGDQ